MKIIPLVHKRISAGYVRAEDFAKQIGIGKYHYWRIENGKIRFPQSKTIYMICKTLNIGPEELISWFDSYKYVHTKTK